MKMKWKFEHRNDLDERYKPLLDEMMAAVTSLVLLCLTVVRLDAFILGSRHNHAKCAAKIRSKWQCPQNNENEFPVRRNSRLFAENDDESKADLAVLNGKLLADASDVILKAETTTEEGLPEESTISETSRRLLFATALFGAGFALGRATDHMDNPLGSPPATSTTSSVSSPSKLQWEVTPINRRTGVTVFDAESAGYNVKFVTYLSRFLLSFDEDCQRWWFNRAKSINKLAKEQEIQATRNQQFAAFAASVEVGLQGYKGEDGPKRLLQSLLNRYGPLNSLSSTSGGATIESDLQGKEARRQIALLFALMEQGQPVDEITKLLAAIDNGSLKSGVEIVNAGSGYAPGYGAPRVTFPPPEATGPMYEQAKGRAILSPNGRLLRIDVVNRGGGYKSSPTVTIPPPAAIRFVNEGNATSAAEQAMARAIMFRSGPNKGSIERIEIVNPGKGYSKSEIIKVRLGEPDLSSRDGGVTATATAVLEYQVSGIEMTNNGTGYAVEKPIKVEVEPPPITARVNMNDPLVVSRILASGGSDLDPQRLKEMVGSRVSTAASKKITGCMGRECYDSPVQAVAYARADRVDSYTSSFENGGAAPYVSGSGDYGTLDIPKFGFSRSSSASKQLLSLIPGGIGLVYDNDLGRYVLAVEPEVEAGGFFFPKSESYLTFDPDFGPRGRSPIERDMDLGFGTYLRFVAAGAICCSGVHLALTPIDVVKTKIQTDPENYPGFVAGFQRQLSLGGLSGFFAGWAPTFVGYFCWGGVGYSTTEFMRRTLQAATAGMATANLEVPIILTAAACAAFIGSFVICPFEAVRIRSVAQPDYGPNALAVCSRMIEEEGFMAFFSAAPAFMLKEIPFAMAKFSIFDISTGFMYEQFPAAREDVQLSLLVSLAGGTLGGIVAGIVSNPADVTISTMKKAETKMSVMDAASIVIESGGFANLFRGLPLRLIFYTLMVSSQFLVYDAVRLALGVGSDDLKLYLDVLGGALRDAQQPL